MLPDTLRLLAAHLQGAEMGDSSAPCGGVDSSAFVSTNEMKPFRFSGHPIDPTAESNTFKKIYLPAVLFCYSPPTELQPSLGDVPNLRALAMEIRIIVTNRARAVLLPPAKVDMTRSSLWRRWLQATNDVYEEYLDFLYQGGPGALDPAPNPAFPHTIDDFLEQHNLGQPMQINLQSCGSIANQRVLQRELPFLVATHLADTRQQWRIRQLMRRAAHYSRLAATCTKFYFVFGAVATSHLQEATTLRLAADYLTRRSKRSTGHDWHPSGTLWSEFAEDAQHWVSQSVSSWGRNLIRLEESATTSASLSLRRAPSSEAAIRNVARSIHWEYRLE